MEKDTKLEENALFKTITYLTPVFTVITKADVQFLDRVTHFKYVIAD